VMKDVADAVRVLGMLTAIGPSAEVDHAVAGREPAALPFPAAAR
jgi:hypothetical protein